MAVKLRPWLVATVGFAILVVAAVATLHATRKANARSAAAPLPTCSSRLLTDWSDGSIDGTYPIRCYRDTLKSLPTDLKIYSSAPDDIARPCQRRSRGSAARTLAGAKRR